MLFLVAEQQGTAYQLSYRFVVKNLPRRTVLDNIGWYSSHLKFRRDNSSFFFIPSFLCLNFYRLSLWGCKNIQFKKKAYKLICLQGFLTIDVLKLHLKLYKKNEKK